MFTSVTTVQNKEHLKPLYTSGTETRYSIDIV